MSLWQASLWKQLITVWASALVLDLFLFWLQFRQPVKVFWLIPYPNLRLLWPGVVRLFGDYPLLAFAVVAIPVLTILLTIALCAKHSVSAMKRTAVAS